MNKKFLSLFVSWPGKRLKYIINIFIEERT